MGMKRFTDQALTTFVWIIYFCQIPPAWVCQKQFENIYQDCSFNDGQSIESQWNAKFKSKRSSASSIRMHQNAERLLSVCFRQIGFLTFQTLFIGDQPQCRSMQMIRLFVILEWKTWKSNKSCTHVRGKKRPWRGRSKATCHQIDPVRMMICQLVSDISQLQGVTSGGRQTRFSHQDDNLQEKNGEEYFPVCQTRQWWP